MATGSSSRSTGQSDFAEKRIKGRFGSVPNFFRLAPETPEISERLFGFAEAAYFDNPLPSLFKERLFVYLSRFCAARYCIARHVGFLVGLGHSAGDSKVEILKVDDVVRLLKRPLPRGKDLKPAISTCEALPSPLHDFPVADSPLEEAVFALASHVFLQTEDARLCLDTLRHALGTVSTQYFLVLLTFVRAAHYWTKIHPELEFEADISHLLSENEDLAACIFNDPEVMHDTITQSLLDELPELRQRAEKAVGLLASIVDWSDDAIVSKSLDGVITSWNKGAEKLFGYSAREAIGQNITFIIPPNRRDEEAAIIDRIRHGESIEHFDTIRICKDGREIDVSLTISPIKDATGRVVGASKIARDISHRKRTEHDLRESESRFRSLTSALDLQVQFRTQEVQRRNMDIANQTSLLQDLSQRLLRLQDEERRRLARELHDSAGQTLAALAMTLSQIRRESAPNGQVQETVCEAQELVESLTQEIRTTSYLLHPPLLDENGLISALRWYVQGLAQRSGMEINLIVPGNFERLSPEIELTVFRLVQECLTNIHRHSGSKTAAIKIVRQDERIDVEVRDRGRGIPQERLADIQMHGGGVGIRGMRERLRHFHGELDIESNTLGTTVHATLPLDSNHSH